MAHMKSSDKYVGTRDWTQVASLGSKGCPLSHLTDPWLLIILMAELDFQIFIS